MQKEKFTKYTITIPIKRKIIIKEESYNPQTKLPKTSIIHYTPKKYRGVSSWCNG